MVDGIFSYNIDPLKVLKKKCMTIQPNTCTVKKLAVASMEQNAVQPKWCIVFLVRWSLYFRTKLAFLLWLPLLPHSESRLFRHFLHALFKTAEEKCPILKNPNMSQMDNMRVKVFKEYFPLIFPPAKLRSYLSRSLALSAALQCSQPPYRLNKEEIL